MEYIQEITLDLNAQVATPIIYAKQGDADTRVLEVHLMEDGNEYIPEAGSLVMFRARKPDGTYVVDATSASLNNNIVNVRLTEQTLVEAGRALVDIVLYDGNGQYLSTASFILVIQPSPAAAMRGAVSSNEYNVFESLLASIGPAATQVQAGVASAQVAASSAWAAVNSINDQGVVITASNVLTPGIAPASIIQKVSKNNFYLHSVSVKPYMTATVSLVQDAEPTVAVSTMSVTPSGSDDPNLVQGFKFDFTLPKNTLDIAVSTTFTPNDSGKAADASAVGSAIAVATQSIPLSALESNYVISLSHGGTGASTPSSARSALGAQAVIQTDEVQLSSSGWGGEAGNYTKSVSINIPTGITLSAAPHFIASPNDMTSWTAAADAVLGPPTATYTSGQNSWSLTFPCEDIPPATINVTVYWW